MKISLSWLKEYLSVNLSPEEIAQRLTMAGLEVDGIEKSEPPFTEVVVVKVIRAEKHSNAENLTLAIVNDGERDYQIVCGAPNCRVGIKTALAKVGAKLPDGEKTFKVKEAKIRGIDSFGMLCSEKELNLSEEKEGIIEFDADKALGESVGAHLSDVIFDISLTPNLGHCFSVLGIARELGVITHTPLFPMQISCFEGTQKTTSLVQLAIEAPEKCLKYACRVVKGVTIKDAPLWLKQRLEMAGIRSINNVVDITNYVMYALGHPLHAFDLEKITDQTVIVRNAKEGETLLTLDGKERCLHPEDLVIADASSVLALAGVMGGISCEVHAKTKDIFIESAYFCPKWVRRTSKRHGIISEASKRFERGTDIQRVHDALNLAAALVQMCAGGEIGEGIVEKEIHPFIPTQVDVRIHRINHLLGAQFSLSEVENFFSRLHFPYLQKGGDALTVTIPSYRHDITLEVDLIEEVAKLHGFHHFLSGTTRYTASKIPHDPLYLFQKEMRSALVAEGLQEMVNCDLISPEESSWALEGLDPEALVKVMNPASLDHSVLRHTLLPGLLRAAKYNWDHQTKNVAGFEIGKIHLKEGDTYLEPTALAIMWMGEVRQGHWERKAESVDFYDLKGVIENVLERFGIEDMVLTPNHLSLFHPNRRATLSIGGVRIGSLGQIHPAMMRKLDLPIDLYYAEMILDDLMAFKKEEYPYQPLPIYPASERDWTISLKEEESVESVFDALRRVASSILEKITVIDLYMHEKNKKVTFRFTYRDPKKTLSQERVDAEHARIISNNGRSYHE